MEEFQNRVNEMSLHVDKLEQKIQEIEQFYSNNRKKQLLDSRNNSSRNKDRRRNTMSSQNHHDGKAAPERMEALMNQFGTIFNQITQRKGACFFLDSVVDDSDLHHSSEPRDFNSIRKRMEAKDDSGYKHVRQIYFDVRSVLKNAKDNNDEKSDVHMTAKTLLAKFEDKWYSILPEILQEEDRIEEEGGLKQNFHAQMAKDVSSELYEVDMGLNELREHVLQKCRRMSTLEKRELASALAKLSADDLTRALDIVAQGNPNFEATTEEVELDINAQSESTLWRLKFFIADVYRAQFTQNNIGGDQNNKNKDNMPVNPSKPHKSNSKLKKDTEDGPVKPRKKKSKKVDTTL